MILMSVITITKLDNKSISRYLSKLYGVAGSLNILRKGKIKVLWIKKGENSLRIILFVTR